MSSSFKDSDINIVNNDGKSSIPRVTPYTGEVGSKRGFESFIVDMETSMDLANIQDSNKKTKVASLSLDGPAKTWYISIGDKERHGMEWDKFKNELKQYFVPVDMSIEARRRQRQLRIVPESGQTGMQRFQVFNQEFNNNHLLINNQGAEDTISDYTECIRESARSYPDIRDLLVTLTGAVAALKPSHRTIAKVQALASAAASSIVDLASPAMAAHAIQYTQQPRRNTADARITPLTRQEAKQQGICGYCRDPSVPLHTVRVRVNGRSIPNCPLLKADIASGKAVDLYIQSNRNSRGGNGSINQHLNSSGGRAVIPSTAQNNQ